MGSSLKPQLSPQETVLCTFHVVSRGEWVPTADCCVGQDAHMGVGERVGGCWWWWYGGERGLQHFLWERGHGVRELGLLSTLSLAASGSALSSVVGSSLPRGWSGRAGGGSSGQRVQGHGLDRQEPSIFL